jgi:hypothetical protein
LPGGFRIFHSPIAVNQPAQLHHESTSISSSSWL